MKIRLFSGNVCVANKQLIDDASYALMGQASMLIFRGAYFRFAGVFDNAVNFEETLAPPDITEFFSHA